MVQELGKRKSAEVFRKGERVRESRERESAEGSENSVRIAAPAVRVLEPVSPLNRAKSGKIDIFKPLRFEPLYQPYFGFGLLAWSRYGRIVKKSSRKDTLPVHQVYAVLQQNRKVRKVRRREERGMCVSPKGALQSRTKPYIYRVRESHNGCFLSRLSRRCSTGSSQEIETTVFDPASQFLSNISRRA